ncbi:patatin [Marivirga lumbricoides]|uniref:Patatin n=1 Tax=Marivirga lumbricoides TaxID=1046115 RepID=A0ABQ1MSH3_9BACT|nr:patatin [Marivirga lumbricoides]
MKESVKVLSIDGGGIRGIIPGTIMQAIEEDFNIKVADYFDLIAGTSTGGILACAYLCPHPDDPTLPRFSAKEVVNLYLERGTEIFDIPFFHRIRSVGGLTDETYPSKGLEKALNDYFGDGWLKDLLKPTVITSYDIHNRKGHFFRQHKANEPQRNFKVKDICRATSAAPTYFECSQITAEDKTQYCLVDGGVFVNNPAMCAYSEIREYTKLTAKNMHILSLGTGHKRDSYPYDKSRNFGKAEWIKPALDIMMSGAADVTHFHMSQIFGTIERPEQYLRVDQEIPPTINPEMDCATPENMESLRQLGLKIYHEHRETISQWMKLANEKADTPAPAV